MTGAFFAQCINVLTYLLTSIHCVPQMSHLWMATTPTVITFVRNVNEKVHNQNIQFFSDLINRSFCITSWNRKPEIAKWMEHQPVQAPFTCTFWQHFAQHCTHLIIASVCALSGLTAFASSKPSLWNGVDGGWHNTTRSLSSWSKCHTQYMYTNTNHDIALYHWRMKRRDSLPCGKNCA